MMISNVQMTVVTSIRAACSPRTTTIAKTTSTVPTKSALNRMTAYSLRTTQIVRKTRHVATGVVTTQADASMSTRWDVPGTRPVAVTTASISTRTMIIAETVIRPVKATRRATKGSVRSELVDRRRRRLRSVRRVSAHQVSQAIMPLAALHRPSAPRGWWKAIATTRVWQRRSSRASTAFICRCTASRICLRAVAERLSVRLC